MVEVLPATRFSNSFVDLPGHFYAHQAPAPVAAPRLVMFNTALAAVLGLDMDAAEAARVFAGNELPAGARPIAMAYAGHQFGGFVPQLGDGRAILLGEVIGQDGKRRDIQLKGAGRTPFSRGGDGRAALGPVLREYLMSEAMHALGIPTTRALAAVTTGEIVRRDRALPGAVFTRVSASNIRVGTFQYFAARGDEDALRRLADYVIARHYPHLREEANPYLSLLKAVVETQASLIARWMRIGFIHGVMNTDNMAVSGETIDYGPCAFMDKYDPGTVFSSIDHAGRYAYGNQPGIAQWNVTRFAETLLPLLDANEQRGIAMATEVIHGFADLFADFWLAGMRRKLGLQTARDEDRALVQDLLDMMQQDEVDFTLLFRGLCEDSARAAALFKNPARFNAWAAAWRRRLALETPDVSARAAMMRAANPAYIPRNHMVEQALAAAVEQADFGPFHELYNVLQTPFEEQPGRDLYAAPPLPGELIYQTFCGT
jgi:uncharacterized protein YdiU (UPF0061 family)